METTTKPTAEHGRLSRHDDSFTVRFERHLNHPVQRVWKAITDPTQMAMWLANVQLELREGGQLFVAFTNTDSTANGQVTELRETPETNCKNTDGSAHGQVTELQENALLEYSWQWEDEPVSVVRWELQPLTENSCRLLFSHRGLTGPIPSFGAGWHGHLDLLEQVLNGERAAFAFDFAKYEERFAEYEQEVKKTENQ